MRQIKPSEVKPGMTIRWETEMKIKGATERNGVGGVLIWDDNQTTEYLDSDAQITVLSEPAPPQPEEPRWIAARAKVGDYRFFRVDESGQPWRKVDCMGHIFPYQYSWSEVCSLGPVTVILDLGWTVPDDTPEVPDVPDRIEEWPEDDTALRPYPWRDRGGYTWKWLATVSGWECYDELDDYVESGVPSYGPWTRVTDA